MTIVEAKSLLDAGHTLQLEMPPAHDRYLAATYHAQIKNEHYTLSVFYPNFSVKWDKLFSSKGWEAFLQYLPAQTSDTWEVL